MMCQYDTAVTAGEASYAETIAPMAEEKEDLTKQQEMIAEIVKLISGEHAACHEIALSVCIET